MLHAADVKERPAGVDIACTASRVAGCIATYNLADSLVAAKVKCQYACCREDFAAAADFMRSNAERSAAAALKQ